MANARDEARRAERVQHATHVESRRRLQHAGWAIQYFVRLLIPSKTVPSAYPT